MVRPLTLHLGCGNKKAQGALGIDFGPKSQADIIHDLNALPWPLESDSFDRVICEHVLEHLDDLPVIMAEIYRVCKHGSSVEIVSPHFSSVNSWDDPTHKQHFTLETFNYFCSGHKHHCGNINFEMKERRLTFNRSLIKFLARIIYAVSPRWYEEHIAFAIPARYIELELCARK